MKINNDIEHQRVWIGIEGNVAEADYTIEDGSLTIYHTYVPTVLEGQGIASQLVRFAYDYALEQGLKPNATCSYAIAWLQRNPEYIK